MLQTAKIRRPIPCWSTGMVLLITIGGQIVFWLETIKNQVVNHSQAQGTASWLAGMMIFLAITAHQSIATFLSIFRKGTVRQSIEAGITATTMVASYFAGITTFTLYCVRNFQWYSLDISCLTVAVVALLASLFHPWSRRNCLVVIGVLSRGTPRVLYGIGSVITGYTSMSIGTIFGGQLIAITRTFNVWVSVRHDPRAVCAFKTEVWGNLATSSFLTLTWIWIVVT